MNAPVNLRLYLPMVAQMVANQTGVKLVFSDSATTASTNGKELVIPTRFGSESTENNLTLVRGLIAHEGVGHIRHTDFEAWYEFAAKKDLPQLKMHILNVIEDPRIEKAAIRIYPGVRNMLHDLIDLIQKVKPEFFNHTGPEPISPASAVSGLLLNRLRKEELGQNCDPEPFIKACHEHFGEELTEKIYKAGLEGTRGKTTSDAIAATETILAILKEESEKNPKPEEKPEERPESGGEGEGEGQGQQQGQGESAGEGKPSESDSKGKPSKGKGRGKKGEAKPDGKSQAQKAQEAAKNALDDKSKDMKGQDLNEAIEGMIKEETEGSGWRSEVPYSFNQKITMNGLNSTLNLSTAQRGGAVRVAASLEELLQAKVDEKEVLGRSGRLVGGRLAHVKVHNLNVFERESDEVEGLSTALWVMIDGSGSMNSKNRGLMANEAVVIIGESLSKFDVPYGVSYFHDKVIDAKQFGETWQTIKGRFQNVVATGGTPITAAMTHAHSKLVGRSESRKVAMIVTDGTFSIDWKPCIDTAALAGVEMRFIIVGSAKDQAVVDTMNAIRTAGAVASLVENPNMMAVSIIESLKEVF